MASTLDRPPGDCIFYDNVCAAELEMSGKCEPDSHYPCILKPCCQDFGDNLKANCTRGCLIQWYLDKCQHLFQDDKSYDKCLRDSHFDCIDVCDSYGLFLTGPPGHVCGRA